MPADFSYASNSYRALLEALALVEREGCWDGDGSLVEEAKAWIESFVMHLTLIDGEVSANELGFYARLFGHRLSKEQAQACIERFRPDPGLPVQPLEVPPFLDALIRYDKVRHGVLAPQALTALCTIALCLSEADKVVDEEFGVISRWRRACLNHLKESGLPRYGLLF